jgi:hypothetical protein
VFYRQREVLDALVWLGTGKTASAPPGTAGALG